MAQTCSVSKIAVIPRVQDADGKVAAELLASITLPATTVSAGMTADLSSWLSKVECGVCVEELTTLSAYVDRQLGSGASTKIVLHRTSTGSLLSAAFDASAYHARFLFLGRSGS